MAFQISRCYHNRPGLAYTALSWLDTLLPRWATGSEGLRFRYPCLGQKDGGLWEDRSVWVEIGGWQMSNWTIRIRPRLTLSSGLYSSESQDISQEGSSFKVDWDQEIACVCVTGTLHEREYESLQMLKGLERMTAELITCADHQKKGTWESLWLHKQFPVIFMSGFVSCNVINKIRRSFIFLFTDKINVLI